MFSEEPGEGEAGGVGAGEAFGDGGVEALEVVYPVGWDGAVGGAPVHGDGIEEVAAGRVEVALVYQLGAVECAVVVREGFVVGLADEAVCATYDSRGIEWYGEMVDIDGHVCCEGLFYRSASHAVFLCGVNYVEAVTNTLHQSHVCVLPGGLLHSQTHAAGVAHKQQVAALQVFPLGRCIAAAQGE